MAGAGLRGWIMTSGAVVGSWPEGHTGMKALDLGLGAMILYHVLYAICHPDSILD